MYCALICQEILHAQFLFFTLLSWIVLFHAIVSQHLVIGQSGCFQACCSKTCWLFPWTCIIFSFRLGWTCTFFAQDFLYNGSMYSAEELCGSFTRLHALYHFVISCSSSNNWGKKITVGIYIYIYSSVYYFKTHVQEEMKSQREQKMWFLKKTNN